MGCAQPCSSNQLRRRVGDSPGREAQCFFRSSLAGETRADCQRSTREGGSTGGLTKWSFSIDFENDNSPNRSGTLSISRSTTRWASFWETLGGASSLGDPVGVPVRKTSQCS